ncbi:MAG: hypothetical protein ACD_54C01263G0009, partial [uncultured bacterium]
MKAHFDAPQDDPLALVPARVHEAQGRAHRAFALFQAARIPGVSGGAIVGHGSGGI